MSRLTKFIFASDSHGDMADPEALSALYEFTKDFKPDVKVAGGDHYDFRSLRKGVGSDKEGAESLQLDIEAGEDFFAKWKPSVYLWGNHEHRLDSMQATGKPSSATTAPTSRPASTASPARTGRRSSCRTTPTRGCTA